MKHCYRAKELFLAGALNFNLNISEQRILQKMYTHPECIPCFISQALRAGRLLNLPQSELRSLLLKTAEALFEFDFHRSPPENAVRIYDIINRFARTDDPFAAQKAESTQKALELYPDITTMINSFGDPLGTALRLAIAGNVIDFGVASDYDLKAEMEQVLTHVSSLWLEKELADSIGTAEWILYLGDNAGETVFDRALIETMDKPVVYAVRSGPIINDATMDDALKAGVDKAARVISTGCRAPGIIMEQCSSEFIELFRTADLIISKGQGNYETLTGNPAPIFFLLKAKCSVVCDMLSVPPGELIICRSQPLTPGKASAYRSR